MEQEISASHERLGITKITGPTFAKYSVYLGMVPELSDCPSDVSSPDVHAVHCDRS